jgi:dTDP-4-amino-4,6-dideoxygalactose transaminase
MSMPFVDLKAQYARIEKAVNDNIRAVLEHGRYIGGPEITELERRCAEFAGAKHALACGSGTDALLLAYLALGIGPGDAVFTTPFTFMATAETITLLGATPVFVDIDPVTFNMDPAKLAAAIDDVRLARPELTPKAVVPVDLFGLPVDYDALLPIAEAAGLKVVVDAAQSFGATLHGKVTASMGHVGCTSFFPAKPLGCYGDGGMCFTDSDETYDALFSLRVHGQNVEDKYDNIRIGLNARMDSIQAGILLPKLDLFPEEIGLRNDVAARYSERLAGSALVTPTVPEGMRSVWAQYSILARDEAHRAELQARLQERGVPTAIYYPIPLHLQTAYKDLGYKPGDMPVCEAIGGRIFSLPFHPYLAAEDQDRVCEGLLA